MWKSRFLLLMHKRLCLRVSVYSSSARVVIGDDHKSDHIDSVCSKESDEANDGEFKTIFTFMSGKVIRRVKRSRVELSTQVGPSSFMSDGYKYDGVSFLYFHDFSRPETSVMLQASVVSGGKCKNTLPL